MASVTISLCICTRNRPEQLRACLESALACEMPPEQILVSDDSPDGAETRAVVDALPPVQYQPGPRQGLGANRNSCLPRIAGQYVQFADDDVVMPPDFYRRARTFLEAQDGKTILTGGETKYQDGEVYDVRPQNPDFFGFVHKPVQDDLRTTVINSALYPASLFQQAAFDTLLRYGLEELDIALHASALGYRFVFDADLTLNHYPTLNRSSWHRHNDAARLYVMMKNYWRYERSFGKGMAFAILGPTHVLASAAKRRSPKALWDAVAAIGGAGRLFLTRAA